MSKLRGIEGRKEIVFMGENVMNKIARKFKQFKKWSLPTKIGTISGLIGVFSFVFYTFIPPIKNYVDAKISYISFEYQKKVFTETMLAIHFAELGKEDKMFNKYINSLESDYKKSLIFWDAVVAYVSMDFKKAQNRINTILKKNGEVFDENTIKNYLLSGLLSVVHNAEHITEVSNYINTYTQVKRDFLLEEIKNIEEISSSADSCKQYYLNNTIDFNFDKTMRLAQCNFYTVMMLSYDDLFLNILFVGIQNILYPEEIYIRELTTYNQVFNVFHLNNLRKKQINEALEMAYIEINQYKEYKNYSQIKYIFDTLAKSTGYIPEHEEISVYKILKNELQDNEDILNFEYIERENDILLFYVKGVLWNNQDNEVMKYFYKDIIVKLLILSKDGDIKTSMRLKGVEDSEYDFTYHFYQILRDNQDGFYFITRRGTTELKDILYYTVIDGKINRKPIYVGTHEAGSYHTYQYYSVTEDEGTSFFWYSEIANQLQANKIRKIPIFVHVNHNYSTNITNSSIIISNQMLSYIENLYFNRAQTQVNIASSITIDGRVITDSDLIELFRNPRDYYSHSILDDTLRYLPIELQPVKGIFVLESRQNDLFGDEKRDTPVSGFVFLFSQENGKSSIENIYKFSGIKVRRVL